MNATSIVAMGLFVAVCPVSVTCSYFLGTLLHVHHP